MICIRPKYFSQFKCDGKSCGSRCCKGWRIAVDGAAYSKYCSIDDEETKQRIISEIERTDDRRYFIKMKVDGSCSFLDDDYLCKIQKHCGEEYLTSICHSYPRVSYKLGEVLEQSLTLTCPIAAKLILLPTSPIEFEEVEEDSFIWSRLSNTSLEPDVTKADNSPKQISHGLFDWTNKLSMSIEEIVSFQANAVTILQDRQFNINERLLRLCLLLQDNQFTGKVNPIFNLNDHVEVMINIFAKMYDVDLNEEKATKLKDIWIKYQAIILQRLMESYPHIFENWLVNEFFMRCYPIAFKGTLWKNCKIFVTSYKFVEFALVMTAISKNGFVTIEELLMMIDAVNEKLDHNQGGMKAICDFAEDINDVEGFSQLMLRLN